MLKKIASAVSLGLVYVVLSLIIGDCHPFSLESMYDGFPEKTFTFYISDGKGNLLPLKNYYHFNTSDLTHYYIAICEDRHVNSNAPGNQLQGIGKTMMEHVNQQRFISPPTDSIQLHQVFYSIKGDSIQTYNVIMYETKVR